MRRGKQCSPNRALRARDSSEKPCALPSHKNAAYIGQRLEANVQEFTIGAGLQRMARPAGARPNKKNYTRPILILGPASDIKKTATDIDISARPSIAVVLVNGSPLIGV